MLGAMFRFREIEVTRETTLERQVWRFDFDEESCTLYVGRYTRSTCASTRHRRWEVVAYYPPDMAPTSDVCLNEPPMPENVVNEARTVFLERFSVQPQRPRRR